MQRGNIENWENRHRGKRRLQKSGYRELKIIKFSVFNRRRREKKEGRVKKGR